jgi:two-component system chemotaxis sensor kinase CheA
LQAFHQSGKLVIEVIDDGGGIDPDRITAKAIEKGVLKPGARLSQQDAINLIFHPGFSTKSEVTEVSGRGVGMDVVKTNIERLQGSVQVESQVGKGTTLRIHLPLTLAIIDGMIVRAQEDRFVIPLSHVHESLRPAPGDVKKLTGLGDALLLRGETVPLYSLADLLGRKSNGKQASELIALVIRTEAMPFAILVDDILGQHQVVIKKLGEEIQGMRGLAGSAILGDGKPALILELGELTRKLRKAPAARYSEQSIGRMAA